MKAKMKPDKAMTKKMAAMSPAEKKKHLAMMKAKAKKKG